MDGDAVVERHRASVDGARAALRAIALGSDDADAVLARLGIACSRDHLWDPAIGPTVAVRILAVRDLAGLGRGEFEDALRKRAEAAGGGLRVSVLRDLLQWGTALRKKPLDDAEGEALAAFVADRVRRAPGRLTWAEIASRSFPWVADGSRAGGAGPDPIGAFQAWLRDGTRLVPSDGGVAPDLEFFLDARRRRVLDRVVAEIRRPGGSIVSCIHQESMWTGLAAFGATLARMGTIATEDGRILPVCRIPVCDRASNRPDLDYPLLVARLDAFLDGRDPTRAEAVLDPAGLEAAVHRIRERMAQSPSVLVLDGWTAPSGDFPRIRSVIRDDHFPDLVAVLSEPMLSTEAGVRTVDAFSANRIVVLSDGPLKAPDREWESDPAGLLEALPWPADAPGRGFSAHGSVNRPEILALAERSPAFRNGRSEAVLRLVDAVVSLMRRGGADGEAAIEDVEMRILRPCEGRSTIYALVRRVADLAASHGGEAWELALLFMAASPDGVRLDTLRRLTAAWRSRSRIERPRALRTLAGDEAARPFLDALSPIVAVAPDPSGPVASEAADFALPELREPVLAWFSERRPGSVEAAHRLLAEECLARQASTFREMRPAEDIRPFRRLVQAIHHGAMSLGGAVPVEDSLHPDPFAAIPAGQVEAWLWLGQSAYRQLLERPPMWTLSRTYGEERLKLEILDLLERRRPAGAGTMPAFAAVEAERLDSVVQAALAVGDAGRASRAGEALRRAAPADPDVERRAVRRGIDRLVLSGDMAEARQACHVAVASLAPELTPARLDAWADAAVGDGTGRGLSRLLGRTGDETAAELAAVEARIGVEDLVARTVGSDPATGLHDLLMRLAEIEAVEADVAYPGIAPEERDMPWTTSAASPAIRGFLRAFALFRLAEGVRLSTFLSRPHGRHHLESGHSARTAVRVAAKLERLSRQLSGTPRRGPGYFHLSARRTADVLARQLHPFPSERAGMLILEATLVRLEAPHGADDAVVARARRHLGAAEDLVVGLDEGSGMRLRLALERGKLNRRHAIHLLASQGNPEEAGLYLRAARHDLTALVRLSARRGPEGGLWSTIAARQAERLDAADTLWSRSRTRIVTR